MIVFISTQSLRSVLEIGAVRDTDQPQQAAHYATLTEQLAAGDTGTAARAAAKAYIMASNGAYLLTALIALGAVIALVLHLLRDRLALRLAPPANLHATS